MAYIGRQNLGGAYRQLDDISSGFDGSDTTHTMQVNSQNVTVGDVNQIILSLGGVIQKPGTDFTVSGSVLTFTTAPASGTSFFAVLLGSDNGGTVTPTDGSVTTSKFASGVAIGATGTANTLAGIPFFSDTTNGSIYTHDVSGTDDTAANNTAFGLTAMDAITTGDSNVAIGHAAGSAMTTSEKNVIVGKDAGLVKADSSNRGVHIGFESAKGLTTGSDVLSIGYQSYLAADTETHNLAIGRLALGGSIAGAEYNVAVGNFTLDALTSGDNNVAVGYSAGTAVTTGGENILIGYEAGKSITIAGNNVVVGYQAFEDAVVERQCVAIGNYALANHRTTSSTVNDTGNTAVGYAAGDVITTGSGNVMIGAVVDPSGSNGENQIVIGNTFSGNGDNKVNFGSGLGYIWNSYTQNATWTQVSDERTKKNIETDTLGLDFINELRPVTFNWRKNEELDSTFKESLLNKHIDKDDSATIHGLIAQEVKAAMDKVGNSTFNGWEDTVDGQAVSREMFITPLIKAVQELSAKVKALEEA